MLKTFFFSNAKNISAAVIYNPLHNILELCKVLALDLP